jgi:hypothetical protein
VFGIMMTEVEQIVQAAYADGYGDAILEVVYGAPPVMIWDNRFELLTSKALHIDPASAVMIYHTHYYTGWAEGAYDADVERREYERKALQGMHG